MKSFLLMSIVFAAVALPAIASRHRSARHGVARVLLWTAVFDAAYLAYLTLLHVRFFVPHWP